MITAVVAALVAAAALSPSVAERLAKSGELLRPREIPLEQKLDVILGGRVTIWQTAWNMLQHRPLTGVGAGSFAEAYDRYSLRLDDPYRTHGSYGSPTHAHQMYVSVAAESGWPGLAGLVAAVALCGLWFFRAPCERRRLAAPYAASLAVIAPIQSQPVLYTLWWFPVVLLLLCAMLAALSGTDRRQAGCNGNRAAPL